MAPVASLAMAMGEGPSRIARGGLEGPLRRGAFESVNFWVGSSHFCATGAAMGDGTLSCDPCVTEGRSWAYGAGRPVRKRDYPL